MEWDKIEEYEGAEIQHGPNNNRTYLMNLGNADPVGVVKYLHELCVQNSYSKAFAKVPSVKAVCFLAAGWNIEAMVPGLFDGVLDGLFLGRYYDPARREVEPGHFEALCSMMNSLSPQAPQPLPESLHTRGCTPEDTLKMSVLYSEVFERYPFPIHEADYLSSTMDAQVEYFGVWEGENLVALSSAEKNLEHSYAEMTDFAVSPDYRGLGLGLLLLSQMDTAMYTQGIKTVYTIARMRSKGMNATFLKAGYHYTGTLIRNTFISEGLESMNVYYKKLQ